MAGLSTMADEDGLRRDLIGKGFLVIVGLTFMVFGRPVFDLQPAIVGGTFVAYGLVTFLGNRLVAQFGGLRR